MTLLRHILSLPEFSGMRIVSGFNGINSPVYHTGYLEWESGSDISRSFRKGEFVVTTLFALRENQAAAESSLKTLIRNGVACIAIKDLYYTDISEELKKYSDEYGVPIMFFHDIYVDDVLFIVKSEIIKRNNSRTEMILSDLLEVQETDERMNLKYAEELNPFFKKNIIGSFYITEHRSSANTSSICTRTALADLLYASDNALIDPSSSNESSEDIRHTILPYRDGAFFIATSNGDRSLALHEILDIIEKLPGAAD